MVFIKKELVFRKFLNSYSIIIFFIQILFSATIFSQGYDEYVKKLNDEISKAEETDKFNLMNQLALFQSKFKMGESIQIIENVINNLNDKTSVDYVFARLFSVYLEKMQENKESFYNKLNDLEKENLKLTNNENKILYYLLKMENINYYFGSNINEEFLEKSLVLLPEIKNSLFAIFVSNVVIQYYLKVLNSKKAYQYIQFAEKLLNQNSVFDFKAEIWIHTGIYFYTKGELEKAMEHFVSVINKEKEIFNKSIVGYSYLQIANIYHAQLHYTDAIRAYNDAIKIFSENEKNNHISSAYASIANMYARMGNFQEAGINLEKSVKFLSNIKNPNSISVVYNNLARVPEYMKDWSEAAEYAELALHYARQAGSNYGISFSHHQLGLFYSMAGDSGKSHENFRSAYSLANKSGSKELERFIYFDLHESYLRFRDTSKAFYYYKKYTEIKDTLDRVERNKKLDELQLSFETEKKEREIELLKSAQQNEKFLRYSLIVVVILILMILIGLYQKYKYKKRSEEKFREKNDEINRINNELQVQIDTKDRLFSVIAHDLRNPFTILISLSDLIIQNFNKINDIKKQELLGQIYKASKTTFGMLENLLNWALTQRKEMKISKEEIDLSEIIEEIRIFLQSEIENKKISIKTNLEIIKIRSDKSSITILLRNLIHNAIKFSYEKGEVIISSEEKEGLYILTVEDKGTGIPKEKIDDLFKPDKMYSTRGTKEEKGTGIGLILCKEIIELNKGEINFESREGDGSKVIIKMPN